MMTFADRFVDFHYKSDGRRTDFVKQVRIPGWTRNRPPDKASCLACSAPALVAISLSAGHGGFVGGDDFVGGSVAADVAVVNPDGALAEAANLVELMGDEDDG